MAVSAEVPDALKEGRRALEELASEVSIVADWRRDGRRWILVLDVTPTGLIATEFVPAKSRWCVFAEGRYPYGSIQVVPAKEGGITATFAHQRPNRPGDPLSAARTGAICVTESHRGHDLAIKRYEPKSAAERLFWLIGRTLDWLHDAARGELLKPGDPFEMPVFDSAGRTETIVFCESQQELESRLATPRSGSVELSRVGDDVIAATRFTSSGWQYVAALGTVAQARTTVPGLFLRLDSVPAVAPWRAPETWGELRELAAQDDLDIHALLAPFLETIRDGRPHYVLVGFPVPTAVDGAPEVLYWCALRLDALNNDRRKTPVPGFRPEVARPLFDRTLGVLADDSPLAWVDTQNVSPDYLSSRGLLSAELRQQSVAIIGAGALGSAIAELLARGGVSDLSIFDGDPLTSGNLLRHTLTLADVGRYKALSVAERVGTAAPTANVTAYAVTFPELSPESSDAFGRCTLIVDTTGSDDVVDAMAQLSGRDATFASVSFNSHAARLYAFIARGNRFPADDFYAAVQPWVNDDRVESDALPWEAPGCWNPVFPASAASVALLAAVAVTDLDHRLATGQSGLVVFERTGNGSVAIAKRAAA